jgi:energy-coupling factor transport system substrate-specific component
MAPRTAVALLFASAAGLAMFAWPLVIDPPDDFSHASDAPYIFALILPVLVVIVLTEITGRGMDTKALAMLGVLSAIGAILRPLGAGTGGIELVFFLIVLGGRVYGPAFGFVLGSTTLFASALLTGGIGPWLPFQMLASSWVGLLAGLLPPARGRAEIALLAVYAGLSAYLYGFLVNLWGWPFALGTDTALSYVPGDAVAANLHVGVGHRARGHQRRRGAPRGPGRARHPSTGDPPGGLRRRRRVRRRVAGGLTPSGRAPSERRADV